MADETPVDGTPSTAPTFTAATLKEQVAASVVSSAPAILDKVVETLAKPEVDRRTQILTEGYLKIEELNKSLKKIDRPDVDPKGRDGKSLGTPSYTEARLKELNDLTKKIDALNAAFEKAVLSTATADDFNKLKEAVKKAGSTASSGDE